MGKNSKKRRDARKKTKLLHSTLKQHQQHKKTLVPPLNKMAPIMKHTRWLDERMPELLWACLVRATLPRDEALDVFRRVASLAQDFIDSDLPVNESIPSHSNLANRHPHLIADIVRTVTAKSLGYAALRPLLVVDSLPGRQHWADALGMEADQEEWNALADAVLEFFWHQSEQATDVRWLIALWGLLSKKVHLPITMRDKADEMLHFPNRGDLRKVRPSIRTWEQMMWTSYGEPDPQFPWSAVFWDECLSRTLCIVAEPEVMEKPVPPAKDVGPRVLAALDAVSEHWITTTKTTAVDAVHEGTFTFVLYALACLLELLTPNRKGVAGRLLLRTLTECRITLAYLQHKNDPELWAKFRRYGAGQAKLVLLKMNESARPAHSISMETLEKLANEDVWQEFVDIDLGNWAGADLRKMAEESGTKDVYDAHYGWNSGFAHGHWAAMRDVTLAWCLNPLHRGHRIPLSGPRDLGDVVPDAIELVEDMLQGLLRTYPGANISLHKAAPASEEPAAEGPDAGQPAEE